MPVIKLTAEQKACKHNRALKVTISEEKYREYVGPNAYVEIPKVEILCADCDVRVARAGTIYINKKQAIKGIILEHWPALIQGGE